MCIASPDAGSKATLSAATAVPVQLSLPIHDPSPTYLGQRLRIPVPPPIRRQMDRWGATEVFDVYWQFAAERQRVYIRRLAGGAPPWTSDPILARYRFTNPYRFSDRVSQHLLRHAQYDRPRPAATIALRTLLFKVFNRVDTWESLVAEVGEPTVESFDPGRYGRVLAALRDRGQHIYSPAYIIPNPHFGAEAKYDNHLRLLARLLDDGTIGRLVHARGLRELYEILRHVPSFGPFLAFQYAVDINYSSVTDSGEDGFVIAGPGAKDGIRKCFSSSPNGGETDVIMWLTETQEEHFRRLRLNFPLLAGRRLQPVDCQNLFCEVDKYTRVSHPHLTGNSGRTRIKQVFDPIGRTPLPPLFIPPKWVRSEHHRELSGIGPAASKDSRHP